MCLIGQNIASNSDDCSDSCGGKRRRRKEEEENVKKTTTKSVNSDMMIYSIYRRVNRQDHPSIQSKAELSHAINQGTIFK